MERERALVENFEEGEYVEGRWQLTPETRYLPSSTLTIEPVTSSPTSGERGGKEDLLPREGNPLIQRKDANPTQRIPPHGHRGVTFDRVSEEPTREATKGSGHGS